MIRLVILLLLSTPVEAQVLTPAPAPAPAVSVHAARDLLIHLKTAVRNDDRRTVASLVVFPMAIIKGKSNGSTYVPSVRVFLQQYPLVFTKEIRAALMSQNPDSLVARDHIVLVGRGELTIGTRCQSADPKSCETGVTAVNFFQK